MPSLLSARSGSANSKNDSELSPIFTAQPRFTCRRRLRSPRLERAVNLTAPGQTTAACTSLETLLSQRGRKPDQWKRVQRYVGRDDFNDADSQANNRVSVFLL
jgi:hypothetical protein